MIIGHGVDIMSTKRIENAIRRFGNQFTSRIYTPYERAGIEKRKKYAPQLYTAYWAAKEATMKALGTGNRQGVRFIDIEVRHEPSGKPYIQLYGVSKQRAVAMNVDTINVSMSHLDDIATASVIFESNGKE
jgi:holo-[acyl-carrier protein] synthase